MKTTIRVLLIFIVLFGGLLASNWSHKFAKQREMRADPLTYLPTGVRVKGPEPSRLHEIDMKGYPTAAIAAFSLQKNVGFIVSELGLQYLNALKEITGEDDGYQPWKLDRLDPALFGSSFAEDAAMLLRFDEVCRVPKQWLERTCEKYIRLRKSPEAYYTHGQQRVAMIEPGSNAMLVIFAGRHFVPR